jgi:thiamine pyrophosphokinase
MGKCIIICAGGFDGLLQKPDPEDLIIAADGGLKNAQAYGIKPGCILGDFDSLGYTPQGAEVFPVEKDDTDAMLAVRRGLTLGYREFYIYGALDGPRLDHTIAALQTLQFLADHGAKGALIGLKDIAAIVKDGAMTLPEKAKGIVSVFCLGPEARGVSVENLYYPLRDGVLTSGFPLGVSNHFIGKESTIRVQKGSLTVLYGRDNGLPNWKEEEKNG